MNAVVLNFSLYMYLAAFQFYLYLFKVQPYFRHGIYGFDAILFVIQSFAEKPRNVLRRKFIFLSTILHAVYREKLNSAKF